MEEVLKNYLCKIASETENIIRDDAKKDQFLKSIEAYQKIREKFLQALQQCKDEAIKNQLFYDENTTEPPMGKEKLEQGWELEEDYLIEIPTQPRSIYRAFWRPPLPFDPDAWIVRYYGSPQYNDIVAIPKVPKIPKEPNKTEDLICKYIVLAVIHDKSRYKPLSQKLTTDDDCEWVENLWSSIKWLKSIDGDNFKNRTSNINTAIDDLPKKSAETEQENKERETKKDGDVYKITADHVSFGDKAQHAGRDITTPEPKKQKSGLSKKTIVICTVCTLVIAILGLLFGDNILGRFKEKLENNDSIVNINGNERKKEATEKKAKGIRAKMSYNISEEFKRLIKEQINPWGLFNSGRGGVKKFDGKTIPFSGGFTNSSIRIVFWKGYIEPYIEDVIKRMIEETVELANNKNVSISMVLGSTEANLSGGIDTVYYEMQKVDRRLRGGGDPESVLKQDVSFEVKKMNDFLDRQIKIVEDLHFKIQETGEAGKDRKEERGRS